MAVRYLKTGKHRKNARKMMLGCAQLLRLRLPILGQGDAAVRELAEKFDNFHLLPTAHTGEIGS